MEYTTPIFVDDYQPGLQSPVRLEGGRIYDVAKGCYYPDGTSLIVQEGRIAEILEAGRTHESIHPDFIIDLGGRAVLPALFNTHCHISITSPSFFPSLKDSLGKKRHEAQQLDMNMTECLARGITNIREAYLEDMRIIQGLKVRIGRGDLPGPRIIQSVVVGPPGSYMAEKYTVAAKVLGAALGAGQSDHTKNYAGVLEFPIDADEQQVRESVNRAIDERGAQAIKIGDQRVNVMNPEKGTLLMTMKQLSALADQARSRGVPSMMHHLSLESFRRGVKAGVTSLSHTPVDGILSQEDVAALNSAACVIEPTCSAAYAVSWKIRGNEWADSKDMQLLDSFRDQVYTFRELADEYFLPELRNPLTDAYERLSQGKFRMFGVDSTRMFGYYASFLCMFENVRVLYRNGAALALANDAGIPPLMPSMMKLELDMLRLIINSAFGEGALSGAEMIRIATLNSAKSLGMERDFGSIEKGKVADLIILEGDPAQDPQLLGQRVSALFMDGQLRINTCGLAARPTAVH